MFEQLLYAIFQRGSGRRAARTGTLHLQIDDPALEPAIDDIAAIIGHGGTHAGFDQILYLVNDFGVRRVVQRQFVFGRYRKAGDRRMEKRQVCREMVEQYAENFGLHIVPFAAWCNRYRNEIAAKENTGDVAKRE